MSNPRQKKHILIALNSFDAPLIEPTSKRLVKMGYSVILYEADRVAKASTPFYIRTDNKKTKVFYKDGFVDLASIAAAWYWRPNDFTGGEEDDHLKQESLANEYRGLQRYLWESIPENRWLNSLNAMRNAEGKLWQLDLAREIGFKVPETVVTNRWSEVLSLPTKKLTLKMVEGDLHTKDGLKILYSTILEKNETMLPMHTLPYPGIWQQHIPKKREWRITIVGKQAFTTSIYTTEDARNDWRQHQTNPKKVQFKDEPFPKDQEQKCFEYLKRCNLKYGAFDFIETPEGEIIFLELNTNGQYGWVEYKVGSPIAAALANALADIAGPVKK